MIHMTGSVNKTLQVSTIGYHKPEQSLSAAGELCSVSM